MRTIAIDPSGNFEEGKGHTGIAIIDESDWENIFDNFSPVNIFFN